MNEQQVRDLIRQELAGFILSDRYIFEKLLQFADGRNIQTGRGTGTKIGTVTDQKIGFHGAIPVIQRANANQVAVATTFSVNTAPWGYSTAAQADAIVNLVNEIRTTLVEKGLIKGTL